jgi:glycine/D-amino acid oxidase-like deaminating enzyme
LASVTVLGSGIIGLWTAHILSKTGHDVTVISKSSYANSTSAAAACVLVPLLPGAATTAAFRRGMRWAEETLSYMLEIDVDRQFLEQIVCYEFGVEDAVEYGFDLAKLRYLKFSEIKTIRLDRVVAGFDVVIQFDCYLCNSVIFLQWLHESLVADGVKFRLRSMDSLAELGELGSMTIFNCLGYQQLFDDPELYAVYGQSMYIPIERHDNPYFGVGAGEHAVFKHGRGFHIGAYFVQHDAGPGPRREFVRRSSEFVDGPFPALCASVGLQAPRLDLSGVTRVAAGIRPFRASGPRLEIERLADKTIVHNYGHGAHGWTIGYGSSLEAVKVAGLYG